ncbi:hypothetical protein HmCmsJML136_04016 [Escherichia coli]|nr:hypothetical protein HmCmsJML136_04016 [Escherichia coli]
MTFFIPFPLSISFFIALERSISISYLCNILPDFPTKSGSLLPYLIALSKMATGTYLPASPMCRDAAAENLSASDDKPHLSLPRKIPTQCSAIKDEPRATISPLDISLNILGPNLNPLIKTGPKNIRSKGSNHGVSNGGSNLLTKLPL